MCIRDRYAGSYEKLWKKHYGLDPEMMDRLQNEIPGYSMRMHEVTAAMLLPQIPRLAVIHEIHVRNHALLRSIIGDHANIEIPSPHPKAGNFHDTMQFHLVGMTTPQAEAFLDVAKHEGPCRSSASAATPAITARGPTSTHTGTTCP